MSLSTVRGLTLRSFHIISSTKSRRVQYFLSSPTSNSFILLEEAPYQEGLQHLEGLKWAIFNKQPLKILYNAFGKDNKEHFFHSYFLKQYKTKMVFDRWPRNKDIVFPLALNRIRKVEELIVEHKSCPISNPDDYIKM